MVFGLLRGLDKDWLAGTLKGLGIRPDLTIFVDTSFTELLKRSDIASFISSNAMNSGLDIGFTRDIETSFEFYQRNSMEIYRQQAHADKLPTIDGSKPVKELFEPVKSLVSDALSLSKEDKKEDEVLSGVLELYHLHNGYFEHAQKVRYFAKVIFDETKDLHGMSKKARNLLEYSALLHDIGRSVVGAPGHEKESFRIIMEHDFKRLSSKKKRIIAITALFHNGEEESLKYSTMWKLRPEEQLVVRRLSAILRIADALDATNKQVIGKLRLHREFIGTDNQASLILDINSVSSAKQELKAVLCKKDLFEKEFKIAVLTDKNRTERLISKTVLKNPGLFE